MSLFAFPPLSHACTRTVPQTYFTEVSAMPIPWILLRDLRMLLRVFWKRVIQKLTAVFRHDPGFPYSPSSPTTTSSDTTSPVYPDRPIRPLPKRPLRSRLSPEVAGSICYPPAPASTSLFYPYNQATYHTAGGAIKREAADLEKVLVDGQRVGYGSIQNGYQFRGSEVESDGEDSPGTMRRYDEHQRSNTASTTTRGYTNGIIRPQEPLAHSALSSNDSIDGYDSFENTNNKKKRKIPTSGSLGNHHSSLSAEMASMGISPTRDTDITQHTPDVGASQYYSPSSSTTSTYISGTGISGAGRGRYGRSGRRDASGRSPLGISTNASNAWQLGRLGGPRRDYNSTGTSAGNIKCLLFSSKKQ